MASFSKRTYFSWRLVCSGAPSLNATFASEVSAHARLLELSEQGHSGVKIKKFSSLCWQARVRRKGVPDLIKTFPRRDLAEQWAAEKEGEIVKRQFVDYREAERNSLGDLLLKYDKVRLTGKPKHDPDRARVAKLSETPIAMIKVSMLLPSDFAAYRDARCLQVKGATVKKELELFCRVIGLARREWKVHLPVNPASAALVSRPAAEPGDERDRRLKERHEFSTDRVDPSSPARPTREQTKRRVRTDIEYVNDPETAAIIALPQSEQQALFRACRYAHWYTQLKRNVTAATLRARARRAGRASIKARLRPGRVIWAIASFAIETAMRRGEMLQLQWSHTHLAEGYLDLPGSITKNQLPRLVPLSLRARRILAAQPRAGDSVFATNVNTVKQGFIRNDAQRMYEAFHPGGNIPDNAVTNILDELKTRLDRTKAEKLIPKVAYSPVAFNPSQKSEWSSPWGQAFALMKGIAEFPREAMTNRFFWQGIRTDEDALIKAMNVAGDHLVEEYGGRKAKQRAELELDLIKQLEDAPGDALAKCRALWALITTGNEEAVVALVGPDLLIQAA